jgi:hypothetical protein
VSDSIQMVFVLKRVPRWPKPLLESIVLILSTRLSIQWHSFRFQILLILLDEPLRCIQKLQRLQEAVLIFNCLIGTLGSLTRTLWWSWIDRHFVSSDLILPSSLFKCCYCNCFNFHSVDKKQWHENKGITILSKKAYGNFNLYICYRIEWFFFNENKK